MRSLRTVLTAVAALTLVAAVAVPGEARAYNPTCWFGPTTAKFHWPPPTNLVNVRDIPVWIDLSEDRGVQHSGHSAVFLTVAVQAAISRLNEDLGTRQRFVYQGASTNPPTAGTVVIYGLTDSPGFDPPDCGPDFEEGLAEVSAVQSTGEIVGVEISLFRWVGASCTTPARHVSDLTWLTDLLVHELGHALGRNDAYLEISTCEPDDFTFMSSIEQDPALFDIDEHQDKSGVRANGKLIRRMLSSAGSSWSSAAMLGLTNYLFRPGAGSSFAGSTVSLGLVRRTGSEAGFQIERRSYSHAGSLGTATTYTPASSQEPNGAVATATGASSRVIQAWIGESVVLPSQGHVGRRICYALSSDGGASFAAPTCLGNYSIHRNAIGATWDPVTGNFILSWPSYGGITMAVIDPTPSPPLPSFRVSVLTGNQAADGVAIACRDAYINGDPNCRMAYAAADQYGQPIEWLRFEVMFNLGINAGATSTLWVYSEQSPALAWAHNRFHLAYTRFDREIRHYDMTSTGSSWTYRATLVTSSGGWVSAPSLQTTRTCKGTTCSDRLHAFWLDYLAL